MAQLLTGISQVDVLVNGLMSKRSGSFHGRRLQASSVRQTIEEYGEQLSMVLSSTVSDMIMARMKALVDIVVTEVAKEVDAIVEPLLSSIVVLKR
jgi:hypothetical protein